LEFFLSLISLPTYLRNVFGPFSDCYSQK
jgi:hypothetical protein